MYVPWLAIVTFASLVPTVWSAGIADQQTVVENNEVDLQMLAPPPSPPKSLPAWSRRSVASRKAGIILAAAAAAFAVLFLVVKCWYRVGSHFESSGSAEARRLAVGGASSDVCETKAHPAEELVVILDISATDASGLTPDQKKLHEKAKKDLEAALQKHEELFARAAEVNTLLLQAEQHYETLHAATPYGLETLAAQKKVQGLKKQKTLATSDLKTASDKLNKWLVTDAQRVRALILEARASSVGRQLTHQAAMAVALAERVTSSGPVHSEDLNTAQHNLVRKHTQDRISLMQKCRAVLEATLPTVPLPQATQEQVQAAVQAITNAKHLQNQLSIVGATVLEAQLKAERTKLEAALLSATDKDLEELIGELEKADITGGETEEAPQGEAKPEGREEKEKKSPETKALKTLMASLRSWRLNAEDTYAGFKHMPHKYKGDSEKILAQAMSLVSEALSVDIHPSVPAKAAAEFQAEVDRCMGILDKFVKGLEKMWKGRAEKTEAKLKDMLHDLRSHVAHLPTAEPVSAQSPVVGLMQQCRDAVGKARATAADLSVFTAFPMPTSQLSDYISDLQKAIEELEKQLCETTNLLTQRWESYLQTLQEGVQSGDVPASSLTDAKQAAGAFKQVAQALTQELQESEDL